MNREERQDELEAMATHIDSLIELTKTTMGRFEWDGDNRDWEFYQIKKQIDSIWYQIKVYQGECYEETMAERYQKAVASFEAISEEDHRHE